MSCVFERDEQGWIVHVVPLAGYFFAGFTLIIGFLCFFMLPLFDGKSDSEIDGEFFAGDDEIEILGDSYTVMQSGNALYTHQSGVRRLCRDSDGNLYAAFYDDGTEIVYLTTSTDSGETWDVHELTNVDNVERPTLAVDSNDTVHVLWAGEHSGSDTYMQIRYANSTDWGNVRNVTSESDASCAAPALCINSDDQLHVVFRDGHEGASSDEQVSYVKSTDNGATWSAKVVLTNEGDSGDDAWQPRIIVNKSDAIWVFFRAEDYANDKDQIGYVISTNNGGSWTGWTDNFLTNANTEQRYPTMVVDSNDVIHLVWTNYNSYSDDNQLYYTKNDGDGWSGFVAITEDGDSNQNYPTLSITSDDHLHVCWTDDNANGIMHMENDTTGWGDAITIGLNSDDWFPTSIYQLYPTVDGVETNIPSDGYALIYCNGNGSIVRYNASTDLTWQSNEEEPWENTDPSISNPSPTNTSTKQPLQLICSIDVSDVNGNQTMNVTFASNYTGSWKNYQTNKTVNNGTYSWNFTKATFFNTKYWWKVYCDDGVSNVSETYEFTTFMFEFLNVASYLSSVVLHNGVSTSNEVVHSDIVAFDTSWGDVNGTSYKYWMVLNGYVDGNDDTEQPCILMSDFISTDVWDEPAGNYYDTNPINNWSWGDGDGGGHFSDNDLIYNNQTDELWVYFLNTTAGGDETTLLYSTSDGVNWSYEATIEYNNSSPRHLSPAVIKVTNDTWYMWCINSTANPNELMMYNSTDGIHWYLLHNLGYNMRSSTDRDVWHIDVNIYNDEYWATLIECDSGTGGAHATMWFLNSTDGVNWNHYDSPILEEGADGSWDDDLVYRGGFIIIDGNMSLFYTAQDGIDNWHCGFSYNDTIKNYGNSSNVFIKKEAATSLSWNTVSNTVNGSYSNTTTFQTIISTINGSYSNSTVFQTVIDTVNGSYSNTTTFQTIISTINGSYSNTTGAIDWNTIIDTINGSYSNSTDWETIDNTINGSYSNDTITWSTIINTINGSYSNTSIPTPGANITITNEYPNNNSILFALQPTVYFTLDHTGNLPMNYTIYTGNSTVNCTHKLATGSLVGDGTYHYVNYYNASEYDTFYWRVNATDDVGNSTSETFLFSTRLSGGGGMSDNGMAAVGLCGIIGIIGFIGYIRRRRE